MARWSFTSPSFIALGGVHYLDGIGDMNNLARRSLEGINSFIFRRMGEQLSLHGDPAIRMNRYKGPDFTPDLGSFTLQPAAPTVNQDSFTVVMAVLNLGQNFKDSLSINVKRILPDGQIFTYPFRLKMRGFADTLRLRLPVLGKAALGKNRLLIDLDPANRIVELPSDFSPVSPLDFGIFTATQRRPTLYATATNQDQFFRLEIDTTALFNSPVFLSNTLKSESGLLSWSPASVNFQNGQVIMADAARYST
nr:hypothetical protein [Haliscomenobacter sp.]